MNGHVNGFFEALIAHVTRSRVHVDMWHSLESSIFFKVRVSVRTRAARFLVTRCAWLDPHTFAKTTLVMALSSACGLAADVALVLW